MLFNSLDYLFLFSTALVISWTLVPYARLRLLALLVASYFFYTVNNGWLIVLIAASTLVDYFAALKIAQEKQSTKRKGFLLVSIACNLSVLFFFKYFNFFSSSIAATLNGLGLQVGWTDLNIILPVGISFYTFQSMSYTIDVYREELEPEPDLLRFAFYISFFPQLIAGPIVRARDFLFQTYRRPSFGRLALDSALYRIFRGLFKKIVLADFFAIYADAAFNSPETVTGFSAWIGVIAFSMQIFFDFSGYTDIAIGSARLLGFTLPENFRNPYAARNISDFWRRWHISLSSWIRDYIYIPLGGSRMSSAWGNSRNLLITMFLCGLWHGAGWNFTFWGLLHGVFLCAERVSGQNKKADRASVPNAFLVFCLITLSWIPFRAETFGDMLLILEALIRLDMPRFITLGQLMVPAVALACWAFQVLEERFNIDSLLLRTPLPLRASAYACIWSLVIVFNAAGAQPFIYFQF